MSLKAISKIVGMNGSSVDFDFSTYATNGKEVVAHIAGVSGFRLSYGSSSDWHVLQTASFSISGSQNGNVLSYKAIGVFDSGTDDSISNADSNIVITVLAIIGDQSDVENIQMATTTGGGPATITTQSQAATQFPFLTGCNWSFSDDRWVMKVTASSLMQTSGNDITISGDGLMEDEWGHVATTVIDTGGIYDASGDRQYITHTQQLSVADIVGPISITYDILGLSDNAGADGWQATYLITDFDVFYPDSEDHHIADIGTGAAPISGNDMVKFDDTNKYILFDTGIYMQATSDTADPSSTTTCLILLWKESTSS